MTTHRTTPVITSREPPELTVLGHVARDHIGASQSTGGAAAFGSLAAAALGIRTAVVTACPADADLLGPLLAEPLLSVVRVDTELPTTFFLDYSGPERVITLQHRAPTLTPRDVPKRLRRSPVAYVAQVIGECDRELVACLDADVVVVGAQGWLRAAGPGGRLVPSLSREVHDVPQGLSAVVFSELDHPEAEHLARHFAAVVPVVALTRGAAGVTVLCDGKTFDVPAEPAEEVDPTGAGDVFAIALGLGLYRGLDARAAASCFHAQLTRPQHPVALQGAS